MDLKKLDLPSSNIELLNVKKSKLDDGQELINATVFVPEGKLPVFIKKIEQYKNEETKTGKPKNNDLVCSINNIKLAALKSLWTDIEELFPAQNEAIWWEIWLRGQPDAVPQFLKFAKEQKINVSPRIQECFGRYVVLAYTTAAILSESLETINYLAEIRRAKETTKDFLEMSNNEQGEWVESILNLIEPLNDNSPVVCVLDTGVANTHPLIRPFLASEHTYAINQEWPTNDQDGHGTAMAGLVLYGDLSTMLLSTQKIVVPCSLESVKILHPNMQNHADLYGHITEEAIRKVSESNPNKERIICMAVASTDGRDRGQPSSWSAAVDNICVGITIPQKQHLVIICAGNAQDQNYIEYPNSNLSDGIHDPGQSWNALTVGSYTEKMHISEINFENWSPLAEAGDIAPSNTTSLIWENNKWPIKPDVVFEGGNAAIDESRENVDFPQSLALLSTNYHNIFGRMFTHMADTSAATAQIANMAAIIGNQYPTFWPETIRGLIVHSAEWTETMKKSYPIENKQNRASLLRICGYGVPNLERALWSASNSLTLIAQDVLKPYDANSMNELNLHELPWPKEVLQSLGDTPVKMRVTLSYFIEPNPGRRGWEHKFRYSSHGLRFDIKTSLETEKEFITRINKKHWDDELGRKSVTSKADTAEWFFGERLRSKGSIHSDLWHGTAISLSERNHIAVFPVTGWWREMYAKGYTNKNARYTLIVTLSTPDVTADIYTPIETLLSIPVTVN
ncbi:S8 family peptidase [Legionella sp. 227]|uniref:S8 family peptidase n=1 Tax=Legionella sp. 227 TaxID=3367288 RepID=UPI00370D384F